MPTLTLAESQTVLNFFKLYFDPVNWSYFCINSVSASHRLVVPLDLHWFFYRLLKNVAIDMFWGDPGHKKAKKKTKPLQLTLRRGRESELYKRKRNMSESKNMCRLRHIHETSIPIVHLHQAKGHCPAVTANQSGPSSCQESVHSQKRSPG